MDGLINIHPSRAETLGEAIKEVRKKRGLTQKTLGLNLGFPENSADVRVAQYESNKRVPKADILLKLQDALNCKFHVKFKNQAITHIMKNKSR